MYKKKVFVFIDFNNLIKGVETLGWRLDFNKLFVYLTRKYHAEKAFIFVGYLSGHEEFYKKMRGIGYVLVFKEVYYYQGDIKANVDVDLAVTVVLEIDNFDEAVIISGDGDFGILVDILRKRGKFKFIIAPSSKQCSSILKSAASGSLFFMSSIRQFVCLENEKGP